MDVDIMTKDREESRPAEPTRPAEVDERNRDLIGENLRNLFKSVETEELPDRFKTLLDKLAEEEDGKK